ncbi:endonuclease/exonuclease/phosphatase family protein [Idiomarina sp. ATCH4]|uniref:endonuclease/exonuclease/phosphatase family protein n=1 Tax=Idiomarina aminovorans TaxID=2914829 RepID=UPI002002D483|nr:endonuclease/exonuclease/phosphatase family protein [Idiomarina sp. ATCH4]MCK7459171.1 endonuclease/exonuclease/phosphatase family protein [Idiomarina sp. ATCH4]
MGFMRFLLFLTFVVFMIPVSFNAVAGYGKNEPETIRVATFNVSMDASNYLNESELPALTESPLPEVLQKNHEQIRGIAEILQRVRPDIVLLNEFDYLDPEVGVNVFQKNYLAVSQNGQQAIEYPYAYTAPVNTGVPSAFDLNRDGKAQGTGIDAWGFGWYPGQYGMVILSKYPLLTDKVRTFQHFLWQDMPGRHIPYVINEQGQATNEQWYSDEIMAQYPLSSKSHWDLPVKVGDKIIHLLAAHPVPPAFDGPENSNGMRNFDEIRLFADYLTPGSGNYLYDDKGTRGGLAADQSFIVMGDMNAEAGSGGVDGAIEQLLEHPRVNDVKPQSRGGQQHSPDKQGAQFHTAAWRKRVDYVLPSNDLIVKDAGVFWPVDDESGSELMQKRSASSDHRLVWLDIVK